MPAPSLGSARLRTTDWSDEDKRRLGRMIVARRMELGYNSQNAFAGSGEPPIGNSTIQYLERDHDQIIPAREETRGRIERKLRWAPGTMLRILEDPDHVPVTIKATGVQLDPGKVTFPAVVAAVDQISPREQEKLLAILLDQVGRNRSQRSA